MDAEIADTERVFRAIPQVPTFHDADTDKPTSALFKRKPRYSVDRCAGRADADVKAAMEVARPGQRFFGNVVAHVREMPADVEYLPEPDNAFHSEVCCTDTVRGFTKTEAYYLIEKGDYLE